MILHDSLKLAQYTPYRDRSGVTRAAVLRSRQGARGHWSADIIWQTPPTQWVSSRVFSLVLPRVDVWVLVSSILKGKAVVTRYAVRCRVCAGQEGRNKACVLGRDAAGGWAAERWFSVFLAMHFLSIFFAVVLPYTVECIAWGLN